MDDEILTYGYHLEVKQLYKTLKNRRAGAYAPAVYL